MSSTIPNSTVPAGSTEAWKDKKRYLWLIGLVVPSLAFIAFGGYALTGWGAWLWLGPVVILGIVPAIDLIAGLDRSNPPDDAIEALENDKYYRWITYLFLPIQYAGFVGAFYLIGGGTPFDIEPLGVIDKIGLAISIGAIGGIGINTAHELGHKREANERWLAKIALAQVFYGHFYIEHNRGHHVRVATPEDPASSRFGENFYEFWPRTVVGSLKSAWHLEKKRYARKKTHPFHLGNDVLNAWTGERQRYERVDPSHSWNSNNIATNVLLYHLQRHSDHHANPTRRYQTLRDFEESPVLPTGYAGMIVLALFPPLWRRVMDKRVIAHFDGDLSRANLHPRKRDRILAKHPVPVHEETVAVDDSAHTFAEEVLAARCPGCGYTYEVSAGNELEGFAAGTAWADIPDDWCCPDCGVREKVDFVPLAPSEAA